MSLQIQVPKYELADVQIPEYRSLRTNTHGIEIIPDSKRRLFSALISASISDHEGDVTFQKGLYEIAAKSYDVPLAVQHTDRIIGVWRGFRHARIPDGGSQLEGVLGMAEITDETPLADEVWKEIEKLQRGEPSKYNGVSISAAYAPGVMFDKMGKPYKSAIVTKLWAVSVVDDPGVTIARILSRSKAAAAGYNMEAPNVCKLCDDTVFECVGTVEEKSASKSSGLYNTDNITNSMPEATLSDIMQKMGSLQQNMESLEKSANSNKEDIANLIKVSGTTMDMMAKMGDHIKKQEEMNDEKHKQMMEEKEKEEKKAAEEKEKEEKKAMEEKRMEEEKKREEEMKEKEAAAKIETEKYIETKVQEGVQQAMAKARESWGQQGQGNTQIGDVDPNQDLMLLDGIAPPPQVAMFQKLASENGWNAERTIDQYMELMDSAYFMGYEPIDDEQVMQLRRSEL